MKFIHLSDLHFHGDPNDNAQVTNLLTHIRVNYPAHYLIITGDITDDGEQKQLKNAQDALMPFCGRIFICPGNHDFGARGWWYSKKRAENFDRMLSEPLQQGGYFFGDNQPVVNILKDKTVGSVMLIALDSNLETVHPFDFACGEIGEDQLAGLTSVLNSPEAQKMKKILFFHHHPFMHSDPFMRLKDADDLMRVIYSRVDVLMFGHKHEPGCWKNAGGIPHVIAAGSAAEPKFVLREIEVSASGISVIPQC